MARPRKLAGYEEEIVKKYNEGLSTLKIAEQYNVTPNVINRILVSEGVRIKNPGEYARKYNVNHNFLDTIKTEEQAYFLGFFFADGSNTDKNLIKIRLSSIDEEILEKFNKILDSNYPIKHEGPSKVKDYICHEVAKLEINSYRLSRRLEELGSPNHKTYILQFPDYIPNNLIRHFIRGYFDGDGTFTTKGEKYVQISITSTKDFLYKLKEIVNAEGISTGNVTDIKEADDRIGALGISSQLSVKNFLDWIYIDSNIYLDRKYKKYKDYYEKGIRPSEKHENK